LSGTCGVSTSWPDWAIETVATIDSSPATPVRLIVFAVGFTFAPKSEPHSRGGHAQARLNARLAAKVLER
jgi:hypothetical protein